MSIPKPRCNNVDCFANKMGNRCELLTASPSVNPCPFFKTELELEIGRQEAHKKLADAEQWELIQKYEYNRNRRGQW